MTPAQVAHIMALLDQYVRACKGVTNYENVMAAKAVRDKLEAALRDAPQAEIDAITELNHAQWLALENVRHLAARNRKEEWAQHMLRWCTEAGNAARILRTPSASTAVEPPNTDKLADRALAKSFRENPREASLADQARMRRAIADPLTNRAFNMDGCAPTAVDPTAEEVSVVEPDERAEFEAWYFDRYTHPVQKRGTGYAFVDDCYMWEAWQAARASKGTK